jgi:hypothetical protein
MRSDANASENFAAAASNKRIADASGNDATTDSNTCDDPVRDYLSSPPLGTELTARLAMQPSSEFRLGLISSRTRQKVRDDIGIGRTTCKGWRTDPLSADEHFFGLRLASLP